MEKFIIAVDTGGTFTDCVLVDQEGNLITEKASSTPKDFSMGVMDVIGRVASKTGLNLKELLENTNVFSHGTTVATNIFITRTGSKVGHITTKGMEDNILIGRGGFQKTAGLPDTEVRYSAKLDKPEPLIPKKLIEGIAERIDFKGEIIVPINIEEANKRIKELLEEGVEAISVCFLWSFKNQAHEKRIKEIIKNIDPKIAVSISSDLVPTIGEYKRAMTTNINAYLMKNTSSYLRSLEKNLLENGFSGHPLIMQSSGGVISFEKGCEQPVVLLSSGPSGGLIGAQAFGNFMGLKNIITTDVGGTSFDVGLIVDGKPQYASEPVVGRYHISTPMLSIESIGAGGGSIAWIEPVTNLLKVGPMSAGADPGPACYDMGGEYPTVTDADVILNRINPDYFLGGRFKLKKEKAKEVIKNRIATPLNMSIEEAAAAIIDIIDAKMADLIRKVTIAKGHDPKDFVIFAFGGGGPAHVGAYGKDVKAKTAVVPSIASVFSAFGISTSDFIRIKEISSPRTFSKDEIKEINEIFDNLEREIMEELLSEKIERKLIHIDKSIDLRYKGQIHEIRTPVPLKKLNSNDFDLIIKTFASIYEHTYGKGTAFKEAEIEVVTLRITGMGEISKPSIKKFSLVSDNAERALKGKRKIYWSEFKNFSDTEIYEMEKLEPGYSIKGPAIIEGIDTTVVIHPEQSSHVDEFRNIIINL